MGDYAALISRTTSLGLMVRRREAPSRTMWPPHPSRRPPSLRFGGLLRMRRRGALAYGSPLARGRQKRVMAGHSRLKDGVASLAYDPATPLRDAPCHPKRDHRVTALRAGPVMTTKKARAAMASRRP